MVLKINRLGVAQLGRVPEWGSGGRRFKSSHPDQRKSLNRTVQRDFLLLVFRFDPLFYPLQIIHAHHVQYYQV